MGLHLTFEIEIPTKRCFLGLSGKMRYVLGARLVVLSGGSLPTTTVHAIQSESLNTMTKRELC